MSVQRRLRLIAGPNGAGKTTFTTSLTSVFGIDLGTYVNPDDIAASFTGFATDQERYRAAQRMAIESREACIAAGESVSYESVMSHPSHLAFMRAARAGGGTGRTCTTWASPTRVFVKCVCGLVSPPVSTAFRSTRSTSGMSGRCGNSGGRADSRTGRT